MENTKLKTMAARYLAELIYMGEDDKADDEFDRITSTLDIVIDDEFWNEFFKELVMKLTDENPTFILEIIISKE